MRSHSDENWKFRLTTHRRFVWFLKWDWIGALGLIELFRCFFFVTIPLFTMFIKHIHVRNVEPWTRLFYVYIAYNSKMNDFYFLFSHSFIFMVLIVLFNLLSMDFILFYFLCCSWNRPNNLFYRIQWIRFKWNLRYW